MCFVDVLINFSPLCPHCGNPPRTETSLMDVMDGLSQHSYKSLSRLSDLIDDR